MSRVNVSDRVEQQLPDFIKSEDRAFVQLLQEYYKSQEKVGRPYDILNNVLDYLDLDTYQSNVLTSQTTVLQAIGLDDTEIVVEDIDGYQERNGSIQVDNEILYYESVTRGPDAIMTPGIAPHEFKKKEQALENPYYEFDGVLTTFPLKYQGNPVSPASVDHLVVTVYNVTLRPTVDYTVNGTNIIFTVPPRAPTGGDDQGFTKITYLIGFADKTIVTMDAVSYTEWQGTKYYPLRVNGQPYTPISDVSLIVNRTGQLQRPFEQFNVYQDTLVTKFALGSADTLHVRAIEFVPASFGSGADAVCNVVDNKIDTILVKTGGSGYRLDFAPRVNIQTATVGEYATAHSLVGGIKDIQLISGGQGYTSYNPPIPLVTAPSNANGRLARVSLTVNDTTGMVDSVTITDSGSGYDFVPVITFNNPGGASISDATIDSEGRLNVDTITVTAAGLNYANPPTIYIDAAPDGGINAIAECSLTAEGGLNAVTIINRGRGYTTAPRCRVVDPVGAQVLDVTVSSGAVTDIELLTGGRGYTDAPSVYIVDDRKDAYGTAIGGTGATAAATIFNGELTDINITNFGTGYSEANPPKIYIAEPQAAKASVNVGYDEVTGFVIEERGINYVPSAFNGIVRGVSNVIDYDEYGNQIFAKESQITTSTHPIGSIVRNLDSLFIYQLFEKFRKQYLPTIQLDPSKVNPVNVIKNIRDFYLAKGTALGAKYLFKILFGEEIEVSYPKEQIISPSAATWTVDTILRTQVVSGDPVNLIDSEVIQYADEVDQNIRYASALVENAISIIKGEDTIYELVISEETLTGTFKIPYRTRLVEPLTTTGQIVTIDSTIGWPERNGTFFIGDNEEVQYKEKSLNQFIECTRSKNNIVEDWDPGTIITSNIFIYANRGTTTEVKMRVLGIAEAGSTILDDTGSYYLPGDKLKVASLGSDSVGEERLESWFYNVKKLISVAAIDPGALSQVATVTTTEPHGLLVEDTVTVYGANPVIFNGTFQVSSRIDEYNFSYRVATATDIVPVGNILLSVDLNRGKSTETPINNVVTEFTTNIQNSFFNADYVYVAASGLPNYKIGPFIGSALIPGNQRKLVRIPRVVNTVSERQAIAANSAIGSWVNGVSIWCYKSRESVLFGPLTGIVVSNAGVNYDAGSPPEVLIEGGGGSGATATVTVNGSVDSFEVTAQGSGYTSSPLISIVGGGGSGASASAVVTNGAITRILVSNPGSGFTSQPSITITGGGGSDAAATANIRGPISGVTLTGGGSGYTSLPTVSVTSGEGALAQPIVLNGRIVSIAIINSGRRYTTAPRVVINGDGFGAVAKATIATTGEDKGKVIGITISNRGINYIQGTTTVRLDSVGELATFTAQVFEWNKNFEYDLASKYDIARGYVFTGLNNQYGGEYAHLSDPKELRYVVGDNVFLDQELGRFQEIETNFQHSPILGWAYDGNPIYGPYGYANPTDQNSGVRRLRTSYQLKPEIVLVAGVNDNPSRTDGPLLSDYPAGSFVPDYEYVFQAGDLDQYNGRFCKTPQYPDGTYAYFVTIDASSDGLPLFPYIMGPAFNSLPDEWNLSQGAVQENIPADVVRYRVPYENVDIDVERLPNQEADVLTTEIEGYPIIFEVQDTNQDGIIDANEQQEILELQEEPTLQIYDYFPQVSLESKVDIDVETVTQFETAKIDGFVVENPGISYQVNDTVFFDNTDTGGFGASAIIDSIKGVAISAYTKEIIGDRPYGVITTSLNHDLIVGDEIIVDSTPITANTNKEFKVKVVDGIESITVDTQGIGYNSNLPPTYELVEGGSGIDADFTINLDAAGVAGSFTIVNSGNGYSVDTPPQIRVSHPQSITKTRYWLSEYLNDSGNVTVHDSIATANRDYYICGSLKEDLDSDQVGFIAKFNDLGEVQWVRTLLPNNTGVKTLEFTCLYVDDSQENDLVYVGGQTYDPNNPNYNPDVWFGKYESERDAQNNPTGTLKWQKSIAGISGGQRKDYITDIYLDENNNIYIVGYTDTQAIDANDIWVIQSNNDGDLKEKRKISSANGDEDITQIRWIANSQFFFTGVNQTTDNLIYGTFSYDGSNINVDYVKQIPALGGYVRNPRFTIDEYNDVFFLYDVYNNANGKFEKMQLGKIPLADANATDATTSTAKPWLWRKTLTPQGNYVSIKNTGLHVDVFGDVVVTAAIDYDEDRKVTTVSSLKYDGTIQAESLIETTDSVGQVGKSSIVDNSGDIVIFGERLIPNQLAVYRFDDTADLDYDTTKQTISTLTIQTPGNAVVDNSYYKYGTGSLKFDAANRATASGLAWEGQNWTTAAWFSMNTTAYAAGNTPHFFDTVEVNGTSGVSVYLMGIASDANFGKMILEVNGSVVASSTETTYWGNFAAAAWHHIALVKENTGSGVWEINVYYDGNLAITYQTLIDVNMASVGLGGTEPSVSTKAFIGHIDDWIISKLDEFESTFTAPTTKYPLSHEISDIVAIKIDKAHTSGRGTYTLTTPTNYTNLTVSEWTTGTWSDGGLPAIDQWDVGAGGLQLLDFTDSPSVYTPVQTYTWTNNREQFASKSSTIPVKNGQKMFVTANVVPKFYLKDATYSKIDNIYELTLNQDVLLTKGAILQQYNSLGVVQAYGTIVETPVGTTNDPGLGNKYKVGKIFGTINTTDLLRSTDATDINVMTGQKFVGIEAEDLWVTGTAYATAARVYYAKKIYEAQSGGTSGVTPPTHTTGAVSDGAVTWVFIRNAGEFDIDIQTEPYPKPQYRGMDMQRWDTAILYPVGYQVYWQRNIYEVTVAGPSGITPPTHTSGTASDGGVTWEWKSTELALSDYARFQAYEDGAYSVKILKVQPASSYIPGDVISINSANIVVDDDGADAYKIVKVTGFPSVKEVELTTTLKKDIKKVSEVRSNLVYATSVTPHNFRDEDIIFTEGFTTTEYNGSFFIREVFGSREYVFGLRATAAGDPLFLQGSISNVNIYAKHPSLTFIRDHQYVFDVGDASNLNYYLSFAQDNQYKLEYSFNNITRVGTPGIQAEGLRPYVKFSAIGNVTNISYYFDPSRIGAMSPVGDNSFVDVIKTPYDGTFRISQIVNNTEFKFPLLLEPETSSAEVQDDEFGNPFTYYSTTSVKAIGPINTIKLVSPGGFYQRLPIISDIASFRQIERITITSGGTEYATGVYYNVPINGDGEGGLATITVTLDEEIGSGTITDVTVTDPGKGYTTASIDVDSISGILGNQLAGSGAALAVVIPAEGSGASVFLTGRNIGKIKRLKNNEFGFGYSHDYTLRPEITFPVNLQLFNTSILTEITITNPGSGYTSAPAVVITGGGGSGAEAEAVIKNNRLNEILIKNPGQGYSSEPVVTLKSEFNYVVNLDLNYLQFNFPHGITTGAAIQLRADTVGTTTGILPKPSSAGLTSLIDGQIYYAIADQLESDQLRFGLTLQAAQSGDFITFLTQGEGRQTLLTEVFGGTADAVVATSRFLAGEKIFQGNSPEQASAVGYVSTNTGWQIGPKILKIVDYTGNFVEGEKISGEVSKASGIIDNLSIARGVLNIDSITTTPGRFIDDVGKPSEIVQKIQDSFFYQSFSYVITSEIPITRWKKQVLDNNHPTGFKMFGQLQLTGGKDVSGRKVGTEFIKEVNINEYTNVNQITSFGAAEPIYTDYNNTEVLFRSRRLTSSEEILTSIVKKIDNISDQFDGILKSFPITVEGDGVIVKGNQLMITLNGVIQSPGSAYQIVGNQIVFAEPPKAASQVRYRSVRFATIPVYRITLTNPQGIFPEMGQQVNGETSDAYATVVDSGTFHIDVINITDGPFIVSEILKRTNLFTAVVASVDLINTENLFDFQETITNFDGDIAIIEETNLDATGGATDTLLLSKTSGTARFETGIFDIRLNEYIYSSSSKIVAQITFISPYLDPNTGQPVDTLIINKGSTFFGLIYERLVAIQNPNVILDDISQSSITPVQLYDSAVRINEDFLDFEEVRSTEIEYDNLSSGTFAKGDNLRNKAIFYANLVGNAGNRKNDGARSIGRNKQEIIDRAERWVAVEHPDFYYPGDVQTNTTSRFRDAHRMIWKNIEAIKLQSYDLQKTQFTGTSAGDKAGYLDDARLWLECIALDIHSGGNEYSLKWINEYFSDSSTLSYTRAQSELIYIIEQAKILVMSAITNQLTGVFSATNSTDEATYYADLSITADPSPGSAYATPGSNTDNATTTNCSDVQSAISTIWTWQNEALTAGNLNNIPSEISPTTSIGQEKCRRDLGLFIDALSDDLGAGGEFQCQNFAEQYFDTTGNFILNGFYGEVAESQTAILKARDTMMYAINNLLFVKDIGNEGYNLNDPLTYGGSAPAHTYDNNYSAGNAQSLSNCADVQQNITFLTDIVIHSVTAENTHNLTGAISYTSEGTGGPKITGVFADPVPQTSLKIDGANLLLNNKEFIAYEALHIYKTANPSFTQYQTESDCTDDIKDVIEAIAYDLKYGGNSRVYDAATYAIAYDDSTTTAAQINGIFAEAQTIAGNVIQNGTDTFTVANVNNGNRTFDVTVPTVTLNAGDALTYVGNGKMVVAPPQFTPSGATYNPVTGDLVLTIGSHSITAGRFVTIAANSLTFNCTMDSGSSNKTYPRESDPYYNKPLEVTSVVANTSITVNVGASPEITFTPTAVTYSPSSGVMVMTIGEHRLEAGTSIKFAQESIVFRCSQDNYLTDHAYPRTTDPFYNTAVTITAATATTITVNVGVATASGQYEHVFQSASFGAVITGGNYTHTFVSATSNAVTLDNTADIANAVYDVGTGTLSITLAENYTPTLSNGNTVRLHYLHFVSKTFGDYYYPRFAATGTHNKNQWFDTDLTPVNSDTNACATVVSAFNTLMSVYTTAYTNNNMAHATRTAPTERTITDGGYTAGETLRVTKYAYKDPSRGLFLPGENLKGVTTNASAPIKGSNSGLKWIYGGNATGTFSLNEYVTNSTLVNSSCTVDDITILSALSNSTKSVRIPNTGQIVQTERNDFKFGTGDFTIEMRLRADAISGNQIIFDMRRPQASSTGLNLVLNASGNVILNNGGSALITSTNTLIAARWHHIAIVRKTAVTSMYIDGVQQTNYNDTNTYPFARFALGKDVSNAQQFIGNLDNLMVRKGTADYDAATITPPSDPDFTRTGIVFGLNGEAPFIVSTTETYATLTGLTNSSSTLKSIDYLNKRITIEEVDLGREIYRDAADIIDINRDWIAEEAVGIMQAYFPDFVIPGDIYGASSSMSGTNVCIRDTRDYILPAIVKDLKEGGNYNVIVTARFYRTRGGEIEYIGQELLQTLYAWREVVKLCKEVINTSSTDLTGTYTTKLRVPHALTGVTGVETQLDVLGDYIADVLAPTGARFRDAGSLIWKNRDYIAEEAVGYINALYTKTINSVPVQFLTIPNNTKCIRDLKDHVLPAVIGDIIMGGNAETQKVIDSYLNSDSEILYITDELQPMIDAIHYTEMLALKAVNNLLLSPGETSAALGAGATYQDEYFSPVYTNRTAFRDATITYDPKQFDQSRTGSNKYLDAANLIDENARVIAKEAVSTMNDLSKYGSFIVPTGNPVDCEDDVVDILAGVAHDIRHGGNSEIFRIGKLYVRSDGGIKHIEGETEASKSVFKIARDMAILTIRNGFGRDTLPGHNEVTFQESSYERNGASNNRIHAARAIERNIRFIAEEAVLRGLDQYTSLSINGGSSALWDQEFTPTDVAYNSGNGLMVITIGDHDIQRGDTVRFTPLGITLRCDQDNYATDHPYPRTTDPYYEKPCLVLDHTLTTITVNVGASPVGQQYNHQFQSALPGSVKLGSKMGGQQMTPTNITYNSATGVMVMTIPNHVFNIGNRMMIAPNSLVFTCTQDNNASNHSYPRTTDPYYNKTVGVTAVSTGAVNITNATYQETTGILQITSAGHGLVTGNRVKIATDGITFTCTQDGNNTNHSYPRATDPAADKWLLVTKVDDDNIKVNVYPSQVGQQYPHTFVSASTGALIKQGGTVTVNIGASPAGQQYTHTFVSAAHNSITAAGSIDCVHDVADILRWHTFNLEYGGDNMVALGAGYYVENGVIQHISGVVTEVTWITNTARDIAKQIYQGTTPNRHIENGAEYTPITDIQDKWVNDTGYLAAISDSDVDNEVNRLISIVTDTITDPDGNDTSGSNGTSAYPNSVSNSSFTPNLPNIWPCKYGGDIPLRDVSITYDNTAGNDPNANTTGGPSTWNQTCPDQRSAINTLMAILEGGIDAAVAGNGLTYYGSTVTETAPTSPTVNEYNMGKCYDVRLGIESKYKVMYETLSGGSTSNKMAAKMILFNRPAIRQRAFDQTSTFYPTYTGTIEFGDQIIDSVIYDLVTGGNGQAFDSISNWFDGDGNMIVYTDVVRTHLIYHMTRIREYIKSIIYNPGEAGWIPYITSPGLYIPPLRTEWNQESTEFNMDSSVNVFEFALEQSKFSTEAKTTWIANTDVHNRHNAYNEGFDWNTDPALVSLTPTVRAGYDRKEFRIRIYRANFFRRGDVVQYIPASGSTIGGADQAMYYILNAEATFFEIGAVATHDGRFRALRFDDTVSTSHIFQVLVRSGISRATTVYGDPNVETPYSGGFVDADVLYGTQSDVFAEIGSQSFNQASIRETFKYVILGNPSDPGVSKFTNGENVFKSGDATAVGKIIQQNYNTGNTQIILRVVDKTGPNWAVGDTLVGLDSSTTADITGLTDRLLLNVNLGSYAVGDKIFKKADNTEADIVFYDNKSGAIIGNDGGRVVMDVETIQSGWATNDIIYGSLTDYILDVKGIYQPGGVAEVNDIIHGTEVVELDLGSTFIEAGLAATFEVGDEVNMLIGTVIRNPGLTGYVTKYQPADNTVTPPLAHKIWIGNVQPVGTGAPVSDFTNSGIFIGKYDISTNFPVIYANITAVSNPQYTSYAKISKIEQSGITARIWVEQAVGDFYDNMTIKGDDGWGAAISDARTLVGRVDRYFRGFDGVQQNFSLSVENGQAYFPDPAGHMLIFVNGILQPPGAVNAYTAFSDQIQFTEPPEIGSEFIGYYVGKLRQLDDIGFEFDSLRSSFNLKLDGIFYSLTLTEGVSSATILPENNILVSLNGIVQEPGVSYEIVGSRIIFAEVPRAGATFVGFSYIGSDADVISATVVPPIEAGDELDIEGEEFPREVALIESSNSLITFEYTGSVKGRNAEALANITSGQVIAATITNPGDGYTSKPNVEVISSTGFDARLVPMMGIQRIDVRTAGVGYALAVVAAETTVEDNFVTPTGAPVNNGFDVYAGEGIDQQGNPIVVEDGLIRININPVNVTVNQGQTATFTVVADFVRASDSALNTTTLNYQWQKKDYGTTTWTNIIGGNQLAYPTGSTTQQDDGDEFRVAITAAGATPVYSFSAILSVQIGSTVISNFTPDQIFDDA